MLPQPHEPKHEFELVTHFAQQRATLDLGMLEKVHDEMLGVNDVLRSTPSLLVHPRQIEDRGGMALLSGGREIFNGDLWPRARGTLAPESNISAPPAVPSAPHTEGARVVEFGCLK